MISTLLYLPLTFSPPSMVIPMGSLFSKFVLFTNIEQSLEPFKLLQNTHKNAAIMF